MNIEQRVRAFIAENFYVDSSAIESDASLIGNGIVDSTGMLELISFLEEEYGIKVEDTEMTPENLETLGRIGAFVSRKIAAQPARASA